MHSSPPPALPGAPLTRRRAWPRPLLALLLALLALAACEDDVVKPAPADSPAATRGGDEPGVTPPAQRATTAPPPPLSSTGATHDTPRAPRTPTAPVVTAAALVETSAMLTLVPAETPYFWTTLPTADPREGLVALDDFSPFYDSFANAFALGLVPDSRGRVLLRAAIDELRGRYSTTGLASLGVAPEPRVVVYGLGFAPVLRLELSDALAASSVLDRIERRARLPAERRSFEGLPYRAWPLEQWTLVTAVTPNELVVTLQPSASLDAVLPALFGMAPPERSVVSTGILDEILAAHGVVAARGVGLLAPARVVEALREMPVDGLQELGAALGVAPAMLGGSCVEELERLATLVPAVSFVSGPGADGGHEGSLLLGLGDAALAERLRQMQVPVVGLGQRRWSVLTDADGLVRRPSGFLGVALDLSQLGAWLEESARAVEASPMQCGPLARLDGMLVEVRQWWRARPAAVQQARGLYAVATDAAFGRRGISRLEGVLVLGARNPKRTWKQLTDDSPLSVRLDAERPRPVPTRSLPHLSMFSDVTVRQAPAALVLTSGPAMAEKAMALLGLDDTTSPQPIAPSLIAELGYDYARLMTAYFEGTPQDTERLAARRTRESVARVGEFRLEVHLQESALRVDYRLEPR